MTTELTPGDRVALVAILRRAAKRGREIRGRNLAAALPQATRQARARLDASAPYVEVGRGRVTADGC